MANSEAIERARSATCGHLKFNHIQGTSLSKPATISTQPDTWRDPAHVEAHRLYDIDAHSCPLEGLSQTNRQTGPGPL